MVERILLPLDGSPFGERALPYALRLASATGARLILMHGHSPLAITKEPDFDVQAFAEAAARRPTWLCRTRSPRGSRSMP